ncbi:hypothetical protein C4D27_17865 [Clostridium perfringens]
MFVKFLTILVYLTSIPAIILFFISFVLWINQCLNNNMKFNTYSNKYINIKNKYSTFKEFEHAEYLLSEYFFESNMEKLEIKTIIVSVHDFCCKYNKVIGSIHYSDNDISSNKYIKEKDMLILINNLIYNNVELYPSYNDVLLMIEEVGGLLSIYGDCDKVSLSGDYDFIDKCIDAVTNFMELSKALFKENTSRSFFKTTDVLINNFKNKY